MAVMIPEKPNVFHESSLENVMFDALEKLPEEYYVFHSFRITKVISHTIHESETDFIIFHPQKGILCLEAKAGSVSYKDGHWLYGNGQPMHNGGPFNQAAANKWKLMQYIAVTEKFFQDLIVWLLNILILLTCGQHKINFLLIRFFPMLIMHFGLALLVTVIIQLGLLKLPFS